ncbi:MAG: acetate--CoA ligase family protein [Syntrophothermus sp.]
MKTETTNKETASAEKYACLNGFFYPESICIAGASSKEKSIGYELLKCILSYNYKGKIYPVNPKADEILGLKCYRTIEEIEDPVSLAIVMVPKNFAEETIDSLLKKGVRSIILITAGFKEIGAEGEMMEKRLLEKVKNSGARLVGPNCMGIINTLDMTKLNATFVAEKPEQGSTGFLSQSGALGAAVLNSLRETDIKFAHFISVGNKADINENDVLHFWQQDPNIHTMTFYLESFVDGKSFIAPFIKGEITKPVIVLKAGKTSSGMKAASSHTGALGSSDKVVDAILKQFGIVRVNDLNEMFNTAKGFENFPLPGGNKVAVITNAGGPAILAVDALEKEGLLLAELSRETREKLRGIIHPEGSVENPVDLLPGASAEIYRQVNEIIAADANVDAVISIFVEPVMVQPFDVAEAVLSVDTPKPIFQVDMPLPEFWDYYRKKSAARKPIFRNPEDPAEVISNMLLFRHRQNRIKKALGIRFTAPENADSRDLLSGKKGLLDPSEIQRISDHYGLPLVKSILLTPQELKTFDFPGYPIVLKGINPDVVHKSEFNAVRLNISSMEEMLLQAGKMETDFREKGFSVDQFMIQPFIRVKHEVLLGGFRDPSFGPVIMFGTGGKYVEVYNDTQLRSAYLSGADINEMIRNTRMGRILSGVRGEKASDIKSLQQLIKNAAKMLIENESITEFDINPLVFTEDGKIFAVDIRINCSAFNVQRST